MSVSESHIALLGHRGARTTLRLNWFNRGVSALVGLGTFFGATSASLADIVLDGNTPGNIFFPSCLGALPCTISGGSQQGNNLFHSFSEFNIPPNGNALLTTPIPSSASGVERIFLRVVAAPAQIDGRFTVDNLLFVNSPDVIFLSPQGIRIGRDAQLDYPGNFLFSTAESLDFGGELFDATSDTVLLTLSNFESLPGALRFGSAPGTITFDGAAGGSIAIPQTQHQFAVVGGAVNFNNVEISTPGGLHLSSVGRDQTVGLTFLGPDIEFDYNAVTAFDDIEINNARLFSRSLTQLDDASNIQVIGNSLSLSNSGKIVNGSSNPSYFDAGNIDIDLANSLTLSGNSEITIDSRMSDAGDLDITASNLSLSDQSFILSRARDDGGDLSIRLTGNAALNTSSFILVEMTDDAVNSAGELALTGQSLNLDGNSRILNRTPNDGGNIVINFENDVTLNDRSQLGVFVTDNGRDNLQGDAGNIELEAQNLSLNSDSKILAETAGEKGNILLDLSGDLSIVGDAPKGSQIIAQIAGTTGTAGTISISADQVSIAKGLLLTDTDQPGGDININANNTIQLDESEIKLSSKTGIGHTGNLNLAAQSTVAPIGISLIDTEILSQATNTGGDVNFTTPGEVVLQDGSSILMNSSGTGGNFTVLASAFRSNGIGANNDVLLEQGTSMNLSLPADVTGFDPFATQVVLGNANSEFLPIPLLPITPSNPSELQSPALPGIESPINNSIVEPLDTPTSTPTPPDTDDNAPPTYSAFRYLYSQAENVVALESILPFYGSVSSSRRALPWSCSVVGNSYWKVSGRGGIARMPSSLTGGSTSLADLGQSEGDASASRSSGSSGLFTQSPVPSSNWREAQAWRQNYHGEIELVAQSNLVPAQAKAQACQSLY